MATRALLSLVLAASLVGCGAEAVRFPAGIDHQPWTQVLERFVDQKGLIDYTAWRQDAAARSALDSYLAAYQAPPQSAASGADLQAGLINLYNALTVREVLRLDPKPHFWATDPFKKRIHLVGGKDVSLDDIEHGTARPLMDYRIHAALVCAAMSCPPLRRTAYLPAQLEEQLNHNMGRWLADPDLNRFVPTKQEMHLSKLFDWFASDFEEGGGIRAVLKKHGPEHARELYSDPQATISFLEYDKKLNAQP